MIKLQNTNELVMVDDSPIDLRIAARCLANSKLGIGFRPLSSGAALLSYLAEVERGERPPPALVLLDINMPEMNGYEALESAQKSGLRGCMPCVAMFSHSSHREDKEKAEELGADGYRVKPATMGEYVGFFDELAKGSACG